MENNGNTSGGASSSTPASALITAVYVCPLCALFTSLVDFLRHVREKHTDLRFRCGHCNSWFVSELRKNAHESSLHGEEAYGQTLCWYCPQTFFSTRCTLAHMRVHHSDKAQFPHFCATCGFTYQGKDLKNHHERICNKPSDAFLCPVCPVRLLTYNDLLQHVDIFHGKELNPQ